MVRVKPWPSHMLGKFSTSGPYSQPREASRSPNHSSWHIATGFDILLYKYGEGKVTEAQRMLNFIIWLKIVSRYHDTFRYLWQALTWVDKNEISMI